MSETNSSHQRSRTAAITSYVVEVDHVDGAFKWSVRHKPDDLIIAGGSEATPKKARQTGREVALLATQRAQQPVTAAPAQTEQFDAFDNPALWDAGFVPIEFRKGYTHLIRAPDDPERLSRQERKRLGLHDPAPHRTLSKTSRIEWRRRIAAHLRNRQGSTGYPTEDKKRGLPRRASTFNRICVEMLGVTADIAFTTPVNHALWDLVERRVVEHTLVAPILFRLVDPYMLGNGPFDYTDGDGWRCCDLCHERLADQHVPWDQQGRGIHACACRERGMSQLDRDTATRTEPTDHPDREDPPPFENLTVASTPSKEHKACKQYELPLTSTAPTASD